MKIRNYYIIAALVLVVVVIGLVSGIGITGNAIRKGACSDDDPENDLYTFGILNFEHRSGIDAYPDVCLGDGKHLKQFSCNGPSQLKSISDLCPKGCRDGQCIQ